jgi:large subunit ribosomal protein L40e
MTTQAFQVFVRTGRTLTVDVCGCDTVLSLKEKIADKEGIPAKAIWLQYGWRVLSDEMLLASYQIEPHCTIMCHLRGTDSEKRRTK